MAALAAERQVPVIIMHMLGMPKTMQSNPVYTDVVGEVREFLKNRRTAAIAAGIRPEQILIDPGFGFGKTAAHNLALLRDLSALCVLGAPLLAGLSRKSLIGALLGLPVEERLHASVALALIAVQNGAAIVRVHDVRATREAIRMYEAVYPRSAA
jgi:dihydropteroate synthase